MHPALNFAEIAALADLLRPQLLGLQVEKIFIAQRGYAEGGFFKNEWVLRMHGPSGKKHLVFSARTQNPYFYIAETVGAATQASRSGFDLALAKSLPGMVLRDLRAIEGERFLLADFGELGLLLNFIPAQTEAFLVALPAEGREFSLISRSRVEKMGELRFALPAPRPAGRAFSVRADFPLNVRDLERRELASLRVQAVQARVTKMQRELGLREDQLSKRLAECREAETRARTEPDYDLFGNLLKGSHYLPETQELRALGGGKFSRRVMDFSRDAWMDVAVFPVEGETSIPREAEKLFSLAKRKRRKLEENGERISHFERELSEVRDFSTRLSVLVSGDPAELSEGLSLLEREWKSRAGGAKAVSAREEKQSGLGKIGWKGKLFRSAEGMLIFVGRNKVENMDLAFKIARGNDVWLHVKARPGSHVVISIPPKKTASLETLLDAALLCVYYSGGAEWGKTEVDYTFAKYLKRIKNSTEASFSQQKTLVVAFEQKRWERLQKAEVVL